MKNIFISCVLATLLISCKKSGICEDGCYVIPPRFYFIITDSKGTSVFTSITDGIGITYSSGSQLVQAPYLTYPQKTVPPAATIPSTDFIVLDQFMANASKNDGIRTFYLTYQGKTDTLGLDIHKVTATADNGGNSTPVVTFDGRPMQSVPGGSINTPDYFVLKRR